MALGRISKRLQKMAKISCKSGLMLIFCKNMVSWVDFGWKPTITAIFVGIGDVKWTPPTTSLKNRLLRVHGSSWKLNSTEVDSGRFSCGRPVPNPNVSTTGSILCFHYVHSNVLAVAVVKMWSTEEFWKKYAVFPQSSIYMRHHKSKTNFFNLKYFIKFQLNIFLHS